MIKLLIVDDSALMRKLLETIFQEEGDFDIRLARNGKEAIEIVRAFDPHVVTLDVQMPEMDGLACLNQIMLEGPRPVVMISALTGDGAETTLEALQQEAIDFIAKPLESMTTKHYNAIMLPTMSTGATDMSYLRQKGMQCYGIGPALDVEDGPKGFGAHSDQERIVEAELYRFVRFAYDAVVEVARAR